ncbi:hypothetical protein CDAR_529231 [Caerostris darwini]|uniref:Uncharacterized protein n=1 Tax=Caerostris darwini TaxID=1538125 RepID=A0AAV4TY39_9ARAC|nr:hypothetical protein CDAR_529231 [Caerostris darwini]
MTKGVSHPKELLVGTIVGATGGRLACDKSEILAEPDRDSPNFNGRFGFSNLIPSRWYVSDVEHQHLTSINECIAGLQSAGLFILVIIVVNYMLTTTVPTPTPYVDASSSKMQRSKFIKKAKVLEYLYRNIQKSKYVRNLTRDDWRNILIYFFMRNWACNLAGVACDQDFKAKGHIHAMGISQRKKEWAWEILYCLLEEAQRRGRSFVA